MESVKGNSENFWITIISLSFFSHQAWNVVLKLDAVVLFKLEINWQTTGPLVN